MPSALSPRHRVFISFHHRLDEYYKLRFEEVFCQYEKAVFSHAVQDGDIDPTTPTETIRQTIRDRNLRSSSVTVVLVGQQTWKRKHVDWEMSSSLRHTLHNKRSGLVGILLPNRLDFQRTSSPDYRTIPARLVDNVQRGYSSLYSWTEEPGLMTAYIHQAWERRNGLILPNQSREMMRYNAREEAMGWY